MFVGVSVIGSAPCFGEVRRPFPVDGWVRRRERDLDLVEIWGMGGGGGVVTGGGRVRVTLETRRIVMRKVSPLVTVLGRVTVRSPAKLTMPELTEGIGM